MNQVFYLQNPRHTDDPYTDDHDLGYTWEPVDAPSSPTVPSALGYPPDDMFQPLPRFGLETKSPCFGVLEDCQPSERPTPMVSSPRQYDELKISVFLPKTRTLQTHEPGDLVIGRYEIQEKLDSAVYSTAYSAVNKETDERVCLKVFRAIKEDPQRGFDEIRMLEYLQARANGHSYILHHWNYFICPDEVYLVTELLGLNLYRLRQAEGPSSPLFSLANVQTLSHQLLEALTFIHDRGVIHCDVKPENILLKCALKFTIKLIDFGNSCFEAELAATDYVQSRSYRAPEVIFGLPLDYTIDIWSVGCVLCEFYTGEVLFVNRSMENLVVKISSVLGENYPPEVYDKSTRYTNFFPPEHLSHTHKLHPVLDHSQAPYALGLLVPKVSNLYQRLRLTPDTAYGFVKFLQSVLALDPKKRLSARLCLEHEFMGNHPLSADH